jgi:hypothetical protein
MQHPDPNVEQALIRLNDAICTWERSTGRESVLILREQGGFAHRSMSGKPITEVDIPDDLLLWTVSPPAADL